jgi:thiol reductant ABC exporter CydC subunit
MTATDLRALRSAVVLSRPAARRIATVLALAVGSVLAGTALLGVSGTLISKAALRPAVLSLGVLIVTVRALALVRATARYGERLAAHDLALRSLATLRGEFFRRLVERPRAAGGPAQPDLLSRFVADVDRLQDLYLRALTPWLVAAVCAGATVAAAAVVLPAAAAVLASGLLVAGILMPWAAARLGARAARRQAPARALLAAEVLEASRYGAELAVLGQADARIARLQSADAELALLARRDALTTSLSAAGAQLAQGLTVLGVLLVAVGPAGDGRLDGILLAALVLVTLGVFEATAPLPAAAVSLAACAVAAGRVDEVAGVVPADTRPQRRPLPAARDLELRHVRVRSDAAGPLVLRETDLHLAAGELVALTGPSGAGKTTIAELLVGLREPDAGTVTLGGVRIDALDLAALRLRVRLIAQDAGLFTTSLAANVRLARPDATDAEIRTALAAVGLSAWLAALPGGLDTILGEDGATVSGGQRRRIALARAFIADADVLIVDEPTAHLDPELARQVMAALITHARARGQSLLVIVHPGITLDGFDRVLALRGGRVHDTSPVGGTSLRG